MRSFCYYRPMLTFMAHIFRIQCALASFVPFCFPKDLGLHQHSV